MVITYEKFQVYCVRNASNFISCLGAGILDKDTLTATNILVTSFGNFTGNSFQIKAFTEQEYLCVVIDRFRHECLRTHSARTLYLSPSLSLSLSLSLSFSLSLSSLLTQYLF